MSKEASSDQDNWSLSEFCSSMGMWSGWQWSTVCHRRFQSLFPQVFIVKLLRSRTICGWLDNWNPTKALVRGASSVMECFLCNKMLVFCRLEHHILLWTHFQKLKNMHRCACRQKKAEICPCQNLFWRKLCMERLLYKQLTPLVLCLLKGLECNDVFNMMVSWLKI